MTAAPHRVALAGTPPSYSREHCGVVIYLSGLRLSSSALSRLRGLPAVFSGPTFSDGSAIDPCARRGGLTTPVAPSHLNVWGQGRHGLLAHLA